MRRYIPALDGLRAIAVLSVIAYHVGLLPGGFVGVDVFFVISGYLITRMLHEEQRIDFVAFYARRVRRILPALLVMVGVVVALSAALLTEGQFAGVLHGAMAALGVYANLHYLHVTGGYFDHAAIDMPLLHTWSLSVEEQFYFLWPMLLSLKRRRLVLWLTLGSLLLATIGVPLDRPAVFYQMPTRFWELGIGGLLALYAVRRPSAWWGLGLVAVALVAPLPWLAAVLVASLGAAGIVGQSSPLLEWAPLRFVGRISYSLYLWHWPVLVLYRLTHLTTSLPGILGCIVAAFALATLSYYAVEHPFRRQAGRRRFVVGGVTVCAVAVMVMLPISQRADASAVEQSPAYFQPALGPKKVALWGDSHAGSWTPLAGAIARQQRGGVGAYKLILCPPALGYAMHVQEDRFPGWWRKCLKNNDDAATAIRAGGFDTVVMAARWLPLYQQMPHGLESPYPTDPATIARLEAGLVRSLDAISPHVRLVLLMGPVPQLAADPDRCFSTGELAQCAMPRAEFDALKARPLASLRRIAARYPNVVVVDPTDTLCDAHSCPVVRSGRILYLDDDHISVTAAQRFTRRFLTTPPQSGGYPRPSGI